MRAIAASLVFLVTVSSAAEVQLRGRTNQDKDLDQQRELSMLDFLGLNPTQILNQCEGDCDDDDDCFVGVLILVVINEGNLRLLPSLDIITTTIYP